MLMEKDREVTKHCKVPDVLFLPSQTCGLFLDISFFREHLDQGRAVTTGGRKANYKGSTRGKAKSKSLRVNNENTVLPVLKVLFFNSVFNSHI